MNASEIIQGLAWEDGDVTCLARVKYAGAVASFVQAALSTIVRKIFDASTTTPSEATDTATLTIASTVFDALQTDGVWTEDATGYNFSDTIAGADLPNGRRYRVEYKLTTTGGSVFFIVYEITARETWGG